jgi:hypothetical protein
VGRQPHDSGALTDAFVAKVVLGPSTTVALLKRLLMDCALKRIFGFSIWLFCSSPPAYDIHPFYCKRELNRIYFFRPALVNLFFVDMPGQQLLNGFQRVFLGQF